jgi:aspartyl protease family protein
MSRLFSILAALIAAPACATDVTVVGLFPNKAVVQVDGGPLRTLSVGQKVAEGITLVAVGSDTAAFDIDGKRTTLGIGQARIARTDAADAAVIVADGQGMFRTQGKVNGIPVQFTVDTGATYIALPESEARRISIDFRSGRKVLMRTANGNVPAYRLKLDTVSVGNMTAYEVDAVVVEGDGLTFTLLGQSFLSRLNMKREGDIMTLSKRF